MLEQAAQCENTAVEALLVRGKIYYELGEYDRSMIDVEMALIRNQECTEAYYYKSLVLLNQDKLSDAAICLEQVIKYDSFQKKFTGAAIYNLGAIYIKQRDFYGAFYTFKRAVDINLEVKEQKVLKGYVDAVLCLMKRKFKEGVTLLTRIIKKKNPLLKEYLGNCYTYRGYGYSSLEIHERSARDFAASAKMQTLDNASEYNLMISQAILIAEKDPDTALTLFSSASEKFPKNVEPLAYQAAVLMQLSRAHKTTSIAEQAKNLLSKSIEIRDSESDLYFFRGLVNYYLDRPIEAVNDFEEAIDKADDNVAIHFISRGLCYIQLNLIQEAIQDFTISLQLDENLSEAYYYRGRCAFMANDTSLAFLDFQKLILAKPNDPMVHVYAGNLLMLTGSIEDATKAFANSFSIQETTEACYQKAKCFLMLNDIDKAIAEIEKAQNIKIRLEASFDLEVLNAIKCAYNKENIDCLKRANTRLSKALQLQTEGIVCSTKHLHMYKGIFFFFNEEYQKGQAEFKQALGKINIINGGEESAKFSSQIMAENALIVYNLSLCLIMEEYYEASFMHLNELLRYTEGPDRGKILLLMGILQLGLDHRAEAKELMLEGYKYDQEIINSYLEEKLDVHLLPFESSSEFASKFPLFKVSVKDCHPIMIRPSLSFPKSSLPSMEFKSEDYVLDHFSVKSVKCKPEAPWLNRVKGAIQFTEEIQDIISETVSDAEDSPHSEVSSVFGSIYEKRPYKSVCVFRRYDPEIESKGEETANLIANINKQKQKEINLVDLNNAILQKISKL